MYKKLHDMLLNPIRGSMNKSIILLLLLLPVQNKAIWEIPVAFAFGWSMKTPMAQKIRTSMFLKVKQHVSINQRIVNNFCIGSFASFQKQSLAVRLKDVRSRVRNLLLGSSSVISNSSMPKLTCMESEAAIASINARPVCTKLVDIKSDSKSFGLEHSLHPWALPTLKSFTGKFKNFTDNDGSVASKGFESSPFGANNNFTRIDTATSINQKSSGLFPKIINNNYYGSSAQAHKDERYKGRLEGALVTALGVVWIQNKEKKEQKS